jgi:hypothetical protein
MTPGSRLDPSTLDQLARDFAQHLVFDLLSEQRQQLLSLKNPQRRPLYELYVNTFFEVYDGVLEQLSSQNEKRTSNVAFAAARVTPVPDSLK